MSGLVDRSQGGRATNAPRSFFALLLNPLVSDKRAPVNRPGILFQIIMWLLFTAVMTVIGWAITPFTDAAAQYMSTTFGGWAGFAISATFFAAIGIWGYRRNSVDGRDGSS